MECLGDSDLRSFNLPSSHAEPVVVVITFKHCGAARLAERCIHDNTTFNIGRVGCVRRIDGVIRILFISSCTGVVDTVTFTRAFVVTTGLGWRRGLQCYGCAYALRGRVGDDLRWIRDNFTICCGGDIGHGSCCRRSWSEARR